MRSFALLRMTLVRSAFAGMTLLIAALTLRMIETTHAATVMCTFTGTISDRGERVAGAILTLEGATATTDEDGIFGEVSFTYDDTTPTNVDFTVALPNAGGTAQGVAEIPGWCGRRVNINIVHGAAEGVPDLNPIRFQTIEELLQNVIQKIILYSGIAAFIGFIVSGMRYLLAAGNKQELEAAKNMITYTITGMVILAIAYAAVRLVVQVLQR